MAEKELLQEDTVGEALHTAMRKLMHSKASSYAWNIVHLLNESWDGFCDAVVKANARTGPELKAVYEEDTWRPQGPGRTKESFYAAQVFSIALSDFDDDDWNGLAGYLE